MRPIFSIGAARATDGYHHAYTLLGRLPRRKYGLLRDLVPILILIAFIELAIVCFSRETIHPIDTLIDQGQQEFARLMESRTSTLEETSEVYRKRRGRHPPPGFDDWYKFAQERDAIIVEDFWDQIYDDLRPFWSVPPMELRNLTRRIGDDTFSIRQGELTKHGDHFWMAAWKDMLSKFSSSMPDMEMNMNLMDEPRVMVPWETVERALNRTRPPPLQDPVNVIVDYYGQYEEPTDKIQEPRIEFMGGEALPMWQIFQASCPPGSPARSGVHHVDVSLPPPQLMNDHHSDAHLYHGFVSNWTMATNPCYQPALGGLHGHFVQPLRKSTTAQLVPVFSSTKHAGNNDIIFPAAMYYAGWSLFEVPKDQEENGLVWPNKSPSIVWRGTASGGINKDNNWWRFQRHRFLAMINTTWIKSVEYCPDLNPRITGELAENGCQQWTPTDDHDFRPSPEDPMPPTFALPDRAAYPLGIAQGMVQDKHLRLAEWTSRWAGDTGFTELQCTPGEENGTCWYTGPYYNLTTRLSLPDMVNKFKFLPDIDGNSFSGRYRAFLLSSSVPLKATIFKEWHDKRLVPWVHFVPLDNTFSDIYSVMEYFVGDGLGPTVTVITPDHTTTRRRKEGGGLLGAIHRLIYGVYPERWWGLPVGSLGHDQAAQRIAYEGRAWAQKTMRKEDMEIYAYRLLLEWARLCDPERDTLGWVKDLLGY